MEAATAMKMTSNHNPFSLFQLDTLLLRPPCKYSPYSKPAKAKPLSCSSFLSMSQLSVLF